MKFPRASAVLIAALMLVSMPGFAGTIAYRSVGEFGEATFSDIRDPAAETIELPAGNTAGLSSNELIAQMLDVAESLERARLTREAERRAQRRYQPQTAPPFHQDDAMPRADRYPVFFPYHHKHNPGHHPPAPATPETPATRTFRFKPDL